MKLQRLFVGAAVSLVGLLLVSVPALAADAEEITVSPATLKLEAQAGQTVSGDFKVINTGNVDFKFKVYAAPYSVTDIDYSPNYTNETERNTINRQVSFDITEGTLKPRQEQEIRYTLSVPADAAPGSHYSVLFAETVPESDSGMVVRTKRVGSLMRMTVDGERIEEGMTESIDIPWWHWKSKLTADILFSASGNVAVDAATSITVKSLLGRELHIEERTSSVFPGYPRMVSYEWGSKWKAGIYRVEVASDFAGEEATVSKYVVLAPAWSMAVLAILVLAGLMAYGIRQIRGKPE